jgi:hypothetical protein
MVDAKLSRPQKVFAIMSIHFVAVFHLHCHCTGIAESFAAAVTVMTLFRQRHS